MVGRGFTFLEIVVVLFIVGLLVLLIYPRVQVLTEDSLQTASRRLISEIQYLYHESMATRQVYRLSYDLRDNQYRVHAVNPQENILFVSQAKRKGSLPQGVVFLDVITQRQGKVTEGEAFTYFFPLGLVEKTVIHLTDRDGRVFTLDLNPITGRVKLHEGYIEVAQRGE
jgi:general secretion pathway protein H